MDFEFDSEEPENDLVSPDEWSLAIGIIILLFFVIWIWEMLTGEPCDNCAGGP